MEHSWLKNDFVKSFESLLINNPQRVLWAGDYAEHDKGYKSNVYDRCDDAIQVKPVNQSKGQHRYIVNHTKKTYVDKRGLPKDNYGWSKHPLPILTCEGNGQGGGDFHEANAKGNFKLVGSWARDLISIESKKETIKGYTKTIFDLKEDY